MTLRRPLAFLGPGLALALLSLAAPSASAQSQRAPAGRQRPAAQPAADATPKDRDAKPADEKDRDKARPAKEEKPVVTHHEVRAGGAVVRYTATAGYMPMKDENGKLKANIFYVAYTKDSGASARDGAAARDGGSSRRPVTYTFNGGPGSASVWLHMGAVGPKRVVMADDGQPLPPPYRVVDNEATWLAFSDLVFIDPVTTGYSRPAEGEKPEQFHGVEEDVQWVGDFIRLWTTRNGRWLSPKFLAGESYGTTRAAGLSGYLQERHGMYLNGIVLISTILNFQTADFHVGNDLPYITFLPTYTTTAWYHKRLAPELQTDFAKAVAEAKQFASTEYALALMKGSKLPDAERKSVVAKLSRLTGLSPSFLEANDLRVTLPRFTKELLRDQHRTIGRLDSRFQGIDHDSGGERSDYDPSMAAIRGPYGAAVNDYIHTELKYENDLPYELLTARVRPWNYGTAQNRYVNVGETLRDAMSQNQALKVFVGAGYYDFATPFFAAEYTFDHLGLDPALRKNVTIEHYDAGHMMYIHKPSLLKLTSDVAAFYQSAVPEK